MSYSQLVDYLKGKYGHAQYDYFTTPAFRSKNQKARRTSEGLYCHHIMERIGANLGNERVASLYPFEWQEKEYLVYCNALEHLLLHFRIDVIRQSEHFSFPSEISVLRNPGTLLVLADINDLYMQKGTITKWRQRCYEEIRENYSDYIVLLKSYLNYWDQQYIGKRSDQKTLQIGSILKSRNWAGSVVEISDSLENATIRLEDGTTKQFAFSELSHLFSILDQLDLNTKELSKGYSGLIYERIYKDISLCSDVQVDSIVSALVSDFVGYGYPQFTSIQLNPAKYGSKNADQYISKGLPSFSSPSYSLDNSTPHFWTGIIPADIRGKNGKYYVLRIRSSFRIKETYEPFIRYKENDFYIRTNQSIKRELRSIKQNEGIILSSSDIYDPKTEKFYSHVKNPDGSVKRSTAILTLSKDDFELFLDRYNIYSLSYLDGCYFE